MDPTHSLSDGDKVDENSYKQKVMTIKAEDEAVKYTEKYYAETEAVDASKRVEYEKKNFFRKSVAEKIKKVSFITIT